MTEDQLEEAKQLKAMVDAIMDGASRAEPTMRAGTATDGNTLIRAFHFITAAMLEANPEMETEDQMQEIAARNSDVMLTFMARFREDFARTGRHVWDVINAPAETLN